MATTTPPKTERRKRKDGGFDLYEDGVKIGMEGPPREGVTNATGATVDGDTVYGSATGITPDKLEATKTYLSSVDRALGAGEVSAEEGENLADEIEAGFAGMKDAGVSQSQMERVRDAGKPGNRLVGGRVVSGSDETIGNIQKSIAAEQGQLEEAQASAGNSSLAQARSYLDKMADFRKESDMRAAREGRSAVGPDGKLRSLKDFSTEIDNRDGIEANAKAAIAADKRARAMARRNLRAMKKQVRNGRYINPELIHEAEKELARLDISLGGDADERLKRFVKNQKQPAGATSGPPNPYTVASTTTPKNGVNLFDVNQKFTL